MQVRDGMSTEVLSVGPDHTLRAASRSMASRKVGAAVVHDPDGEGVGILTERDVLASVGAGEDPDVERVRDHVTTDLVYAAPSWTL
ncbi:MAG TPA: CBS domain-containing protein, partial [Actinomycetes bacterium]|nr:CBS domain-containing protein [Actinomycetes bacterium]